MFAKHTLINLIYLISCMSYFETTYCQRLFWCVSNPKPHFVSPNVTIDNTWKPVSSTLYCGNNDCSRELHVTLGENISWQKGKELSEEHSVMQGITEGIISGTTASVKAEIGFPIKMVTATVGTEVQFQKSTTRENSIETSYTDGSTVTYSLTRETSMQTGEVAICTAKAGQGVKLLARTNAIRFTGWYCQPLEPYNNVFGLNTINCKQTTAENKFAECTYLDFKMLPFSGNAISADIKCSSDNSSSKK